MGPPPPKKPRLAGPGAKPKEGPPKAALAPRQPAVLLGDPEEEANQKAIAAIIEKVMKADKKDLFRARLASLPPGPAPCALRPARQTGAETQQPSVRASTQPLPLSFLPPASAEARGGHQPAAEGGLPGARDAADGLQHDEGEAPRALVPRAVEGAEGRGAEGGLEKP